MKKQAFFRIMVTAIFAAWLSASTAGAAVFVRVAPPRPLVERVVPPPNRSYVWVGGRWVAPPRPGVVWVPAHWDYVPARRSYVFVAGFWR
jgi:hypothetical protein